MNAKKYWRLANMVTSGDALTSMAECYLQVGGINQIPTAVQVSSSYHGGGVTGDKAIDGDPNTRWMTDGNSPPVYIEFEYASPIAPESLYIQAPTGDLANRTPYAGKLYYSNTGFGGPWTLQTDWAMTDTTWSDTQIQVYTFGTGESTEILSTKVSPLVVARFSTESMLATKTTCLMPINFPTYEIDVTMAKALMTSSTNYQLRATKASPLVVCLGRRALPNVRVWTFTLDGHDFYVINLQEETLVYDLHSDKWSCWGTGDSRSWRVQRGMNWNANVGIQQATLGGDSVSNVIVGDEETAALYFLKPEQADDDNSTGTGKGKFARIVYGQIITRGNNYVNCPGIEVSASNGETTQALTNTATLYYSDDKGKTLISAGTLSITPGEMDVTLSWRSMGSFNSPGRLLRLVDYGMTRIDSIELIDE